MINDLGYETLSKKQMDALRDGIEAPTRTPDSSIPTTNIALWMMGCDEYGRSVCIWIHHTVPYFYVGISHPDPKWAKTHAPVYARLLRSFLDYRAQQEPWNKRPKVVDVQIVKRRWFYGYRPDPEHDARLPIWRNNNAAPSGETRTPEDRDGAKLSHKTCPGTNLPWSGTTTQASDYYLRVCAGAPYHVNKLREWCAIWVQHMGSLSSRNGAAAMGSGLTPADRWVVPQVRTTSTVMIPVSLSIFEANVEFTLRCMIDVGLVGSGWCVIHRGGRSLPGAVRQLRKRRSNCDLEYVVDGSIFERAQMARNRVLLHGRGLVDPTTPLDDPWEAVRQVLDPGAQGCCLRFVSRKAAFQRFVDGVGPATQHPDPMEDWFEMLRAATAPLRIMSFDIECCNDRGSFPDPEEEDGQVINLAARMYRLDRVEAYENAHRKLSEANANAEEEQEDWLDREPESWRDQMQDLDPGLEALGIDPRRNKWSPPFDAVVMGVGAREPMANGGMNGYRVDSFSFASEQEMLIAFARLIRAWDPDIIQGYNSVAFDMSYLLRRAKTLGIAAQFWELGRLRNRLSPPKLQEFKNKAKGHRKEYLSHIHGRVQFDLLRACRDDIALKLRSYKLQNVAVALLGEGKKDMPYELIPQKHHESPVTRRELDEYCDADAALPFMIERTQSYLMRYIEMARVTGVPLRFLLTKGQQVQAFSQLLRKARERGFAVPWLPVVEPQENLTEARKKKAYQGAVVIDPKVGFYTSAEEGPVVVTDYRSLYPSSIMSQNLDFATMITDPVACALCHAQDLRRRDAHDREKESQDPWYDGSLLLRDYEAEFGWKVAPVDAVGRQNPVFVRHEVRRGLVGEILDELLQARGVAKKAMNMYPLGSPEYNVQNARQMALKVTANSFYGFTGAPVGRQPNLLISAATTAYGRCALYLAKRLGEGALPGDNEVIYGDTDSVFLLVKDAATHQEPKPGLPIGPKASVAMQIAFDRCALLDQEINKRVLKPMRTEREKGYDPYLSLGPKKYAALKWEDPEAPYDIDAKGIEMVRRDNPHIVGLTCRVFVEMLMGKGPSIKKKNSRSKRVVALWPDVEMATELLRRVRAQMETDRLPFEAYLISAKFSKPPEEYKNMPPHIDLALRMQQRDPASAPQMGDRVPYVIVAPCFSTAVQEFRKSVLYKDTRGVKTHDCAEDPTYAKQHGMWVDTAIYVQNKLDPVFLRLLAPVLAHYELRHGIPKNPGMFTRQANRYRDQHEKLEKWKTNKRQEMAEQVVREIVYQQPDRAKKIRRIRTHADCAIERAFAHGRRRHHQQQQQQPVPNLSKQHDERYAETTVIGSSHGSNDLSDEIDEVHAKEKIEAILSGIRKQVEIDILAKRAQGSVSHGNSDPATRGLVTPMPQRRRSSQPRQSRITAFFERDPISTDASTTTTTAAPGANPVSAGDPMSTQQTPITAFFGQQQQQQQPERHV